MLMSRKLKWKEKMNKIGKMKRVKMKTKNKIGRMILLRRMGRLLKKNMKRNKLRRKRRNQKKVRSKLIT